jgi:hypothetical protein
MVPFLDALPAPLANLKKGSGLKETITFNILSRKIEKTGTVREGLSVHQILAVHNAHFKLAFYELVSGFKAKLIMPQSIQ